MNRLIDGTEYRDVECGIVARRGKRELYLLAKSVVQGERARKLLATHSFNRLFAAGRKSPHSRNVAYLRVSNAA